MKMEYICLKKVGKGFLSTRKPEIVDKELIISFFGAPTDVTVIFENANGNSLYRTLTDNTCALPIDFLVGEIRVVITLLNGKSKKLKIVCESICAEQKNGTTFVYPNGLDLPMQIIEIYSELQKMKCDMEEMHVKHNTLDAKVGKLLDGYDFD